MYFKNWLKPKGRIYLKNIGHEMIWITAQSHRNHKPKYRYSSPKHHRKLNNAYYFELNETRFHVCKYFFNVTLDVNDRPIRTVISKQGISTSLQTELRGKHMKYRTISDGLKNYVRQQIDSIPRIESHYLRTQTIWEYIAGVYSLSRLRRDYRDNCITANTTYWRIL